MKTPESWLAALAVLAFAIPSQFVLVALTSGRVQIKARAVFAATMALALSVLCTLGAFLSRGYATEATPLLAVQVDRITCIMLLLVSSIGLVIVRYSRSYLEGEAGAARYFRSLLLLLGAVSSLVIADNLLVVALAWTAASLALHQLLTFYPERGAARIAAHKKFVVSRLADIFLAASLALLYANVGSLRFEAIGRWASAHPTLTPSAQLAAVCLVLAVALRSAQLPFHGWLIQVMEAPTPVSAVLHAGVVNIGGFVLLRLAPLVNSAPAARILLVFVGLVTAIVAALVMTTRISVKVALAWSTCAQMGFMLVQCGLGAWHLALLHMVAHSLYKAHAFLRAGSTVEKWRLQAMAPPQAVLSWGTVQRTLLPAMVIGSLVAVALAPLTNLRPAAVVSVLVLAIVVGLAIVPMLAQAEKAGPVPRGTSVLRALGVALLYVAWHFVAAEVLPDTATTTMAGTVAETLGWLLVGAALVGLFCFKTTLQQSPASPLARTLYPWLFAGLYLDEHFTRWAFRLWPPPLRPSPSVPATLLQDISEART